MATFDKILHAKVFHILSIKGVGPATFWKTLGFKQSIENVYEYFAFKYSLKNLEEQISLIEKYSSEGINCVGFWEEGYPIILKNLNNYPPIIWYKGKKELFNNFALAVVGGRNASFHGVRFAYYLSESFAKNGICVVSGLARGIDTASHKGAISCGSTIAVLAGGVDCLYPKENQELYNSLCENHLVVSEMPPGTEPTAELFPRRNRLISALTSGVCIIEAAIKSGSLITSAYALDMGLPIFACPGNPYDPRSKGCNQLIKQGAYLLESADDVLEHLSFFNKAQTIKTVIPQNNLKADNDLNQKILNMLSHTPVTIEDILEHFSNYSPQHILTLLGELELQQLVTKYNNSFVLA